MSSWFHDTIIKANGLSYLFFGTTKLQFVQWFTQNNSFENDVRKWPAHALLLRLS